MSPVSPPSSGKRSLRQCSTNFAKFTGSSSTDAAKKQKCCCFTCQRHPKTTCVKLGEHAVAELMCKSNQSNRSSDIRHFSDYFVICRHISLYFVISSNVNGLAHQLFQHMLVTPYMVHTGSILGPQFPKKITQFTKVHALLTGSHWILLDFTSPCCLSHSLPFSACVQSTLLELCANFHQRQEVLSMLRACSPLRIKSIKHQNEALQPKDANGGHRNRDARCKLCSLSLSLKHETTRETQTNFSN